MASERQNEREVRRKAIEVQVRHLWGEQSIFLEELIHLQDEARQRAYDELLTLEDRKVTSPPAGSHDFLVFIDRDFDLDYVTDFSLGPERNALISNISAISSLPSAHLKENEQLAFKRILGGALTCAIEEAYEQANVQLEAGRDYLRKRTAEQSRRWMLTSILPIILILVLTGFACQDLFQAELDKTPAWLVAVYFGLLGSFCSMILWGGRRELDSASGAWLHFLEVVVRFSFGAAVGLIVTYIMVSPLCPEAFAGLINAPGGVQTIGFIAGFNEKWIHSFVSKYQLDK